MGRLRRVRGVSWEWSDPDHPSYREGRQMGVIAQELREVFPDLVREGSDGFLTVDYAGLLAPVVEALKELDARLSAIEARIAPRREDPPPASRQVDGTTDSTMQEQTMSDETGGAPIVEGRGLHLTGNGEVEAHRRHFGRDQVEDPPETEAHGSLRISFPPGAGEQTLTVTYRPAARPGGEPEVEVHGRLVWSDIRLKRDVRPI
jgi:hypothetical protein